MSLGRFLISKIFFKNLLLALIITLVLLFIVWQGLRIFTFHGKNLSVPDYTGLTLRDIERLKMDRDFEFIVLDSIFDNTMPKGSIVMQDPPPNSKVKKGRKIYLTTVAMLPEQVRMPDLVDLTFRQALSTLQTYGLLVGRLDYVPDIAKNAVLQQLHDGEVIEPGTFVLKGSQIDLILGQGLSAERIPLPFLLGLTEAEAHLVIRLSYLNVGANIVETDEEVDSLVRVYRQHPAWTENAFLQMGQSVDLWYRSALEFDFDSLLRIYQPDTLLLNDTIYFDTIYFDTIFSP